eukprot:c7164_g1_i1.p1 GENE.c7164_g1_i1~~c7164_g1_i1.p1  ORF type:complete len:204 (-),score=45.67 c7164_g1_i1:378-989(-)
MSFQVNWPEFFDESLRQNLICKINEALANSAPEGGPLVVPMQCEDIGFGQQAPELAIGAVTEATADEVEFAAQFAYKGNAFITLATKVQANPMHSTQALQCNAQRVIGFVGANQRYVLPLRMTLTNWEVKGSVRVRVDVKSKKASITIESNPLHKFQITSNFDAIPSAGASLRKSVTAQIHEGISKGLLSRPLTFGAPASKTA